MDAEIIAQVDVEKSKNVTTRVQLTKFADQMGISVRDFTRCAGEWMPKKQGIWIPLHNAERVAAAILDMERASEDGIAPLAELTQEARVLNELPFPATRA